LGLFVHLPWLYFGCGYAAPCISWLKAFAFFYYDTITLCNYFMVGWTNMSESYAVLTETPASPVLFF